MNCSDCGREDGRLDILYLVGKFPCENGWRVFVSCDDFAHVVLEGIDDGWIGVEFCL